MTSEDVLKPQLIWIEGRCYRKMPPRQSSSTPIADTEDLYPGEYQKPYEEQHQIPIKHLNDNFYNSITAPASLENDIRYRCKRISFDLKNEKVEIVVPKCARGFETIEITIKGPTQRGAYEASRKILEAIDNARLRCDFTHFVSIPVNMKNIQTSFLKFKDVVLQNCKQSRGLHESIFQDPARLHITIITLVLLNSHDCEHARATLQGCRDDIMSNFLDEPLTVMVRGLEIMNDDPGEVDVLYGKVELDDADVLERISDLLIKKFNEAKLVCKLEAKVKFHVTLMNTLFRANDGSMKERKTFDASQVLKKYSDYEFGSFKVSQVHVSCRSTTADDGYYIPEASITLDKKKT